MTTTPRKKPVLSEADTERAQAIIAANLAAAAMAHNDGITIRGKSPWQPSVTGTARAKNPLPVPASCPCCSGQAIACLHHDEIQGRSNSVWPWSFVCRSCGARVDLLPFTNIPSGQLARRAP